MTESTDITEIRRAVQALCADFPGSYWQEKDRDRAYPGEFVDALTRSGFLAALIPEEFGGSGLTLDAAAVIMEEIQAAGCNGASAHAQMYIMNTLLKYGSDAQKRDYLPGIANGTVTRPDFNERVKAYMVYNLAVGITAFSPDFRINLGVKNLFDTDPPFAITYDGNTGAGSSWEPRVADPRGRSFTAGVEFRF